MKIMIKQFGLTFLLLLAVQPGTAEPQAEQTTRAPNIVFIFIDDMGWGDLGCHRVTASADAERDGARGGNDFIDTPHIDQLAAEGVRITDFYASGAVCSPTQGAVLSGQNQARIGITARLLPRLAPGETMACADHAPGMAHRSLPVRKADRRQDI